MISIIAAIAKHNVLGMNNRLPWHLPADLAYFKQLTVGKPVVMGRKTFESIGKPLPNRQNFVITRQKNYTSTGVFIYSSLESVLAALKDAPEIMIIGGADIYRQAIPLANRMYLTFVDCECEGDTFFPVWDEQAWRLLSEETCLPDEKNQYAFTRRIFERQ